MRKKKEQPSFDKGRLCELIMATKSANEKKEEKERKERMEMQKGIVEKNIKLVDELRALWHDFVSRHQKELTDIFEVSKCLFENLNWKCEHTECFVNGDAVKGLDISFMMELSIRYKGERFGNRIPENDYFIARGNIEKWNQESGGILFMFSPTDTENNIFLSEELFSLEEYLNRIVNSEHPNVANACIVETIILFKALFIAIKNYKKRLEEYIVDSYNYTKQ